MSLPKSDSPTNDDPKDKTTAKDSEQPKDAQLSPEATEQVEETSTQVPTDAVSGQGADIDQPTILTPQQDKEVIPQVVIEDEQEKDSPQAEPATEVPGVDLNAPLKIDEAKTETDIPSVDPDAELKIDKVKDAGESIPESDMNAHLKVEDAKVSEDTTQMNSNKSLFIVGGIVGLIFVVSAIAFFFFVVKNQKVEEKEVVPVEEEQVQSESPAVSFDRSQWSLEVLNGSGIAGLAKTSADKLEALGYKIVKVGNSGKNNVVKTEIQISEEFSGKSEELLKDISENFKDATVSGVLKDSTASARVILGSE